MSRDHPDTYWYGFGRSIQQLWLPEILPRLKDTLLFDGKKSDTQKIKEFIDGRKSGWDVMMQEESF